MANAHVSSKQHPECDDDFDSELCRVSDRLAVELTLLQGQENEMRQYMIEPTDDDSGSVDNATGDAAADDDNSRWLSLADEFVISLDDSDHDDDDSIGSADAVSVMGQGRQRSKKCKIDTTCK